VLETATGSRAQPLIWAITTAGVNRASVCYDQRSHVIDILQRRQIDESYFGIIYTLDDGDDPFDEANWIKSNPNYGVSIYEDALRSTAKRAQQMPSALNAFLSRHCNIWVNADSSWLPSGAWEKCGDESLSIEDFAGQRCFIGLDLARHNDIAAMVVLFPPRAGRDYWAVFGRYYLPSETVERSENTHYQTWEQMRLLTQTNGPTTNFVTIIADLSDIVNRFDVVEIVLDPYDSGPFESLLTNEGIDTPQVHVKQTAFNMGPPMVTLEGLVLEKRIHHDGDEVLAWMMSNVVWPKEGSFVPGPIEPAT